MVLDVPFKLSSSQEVDIPMGVEGNIIIGNNFIPRQELKDAMQASAKWPYAGHQDGWYRAHEAIRADLVDVSDALKAVVRQLQSGKRLEPFQLANIKTLWPKFLKSIHHHHHREEEVVFPWLATRITLPPKMAADHKTLMRLMDECTGMVTHLAPGRPASVDLLQWSALSGKFEVFRREMLAHLREEDEMGLPMMRMHFSHKEFKPVEKKLMKGGVSLDDIGWLLRAFPNDTERRKWMTDVAKIPSLVQSWIMLPACRRWQNTYVRMLEELKLGQQIPKEPTGCLAC